jgi:pyrroloquinoline quinone biosynthesis protein B
LRIRVLGSAAGGGFPQWNCGCTNCVGVRRGVLRATARTQESIAVSADGDAWFLLNASPEIRAQIESFAPLLPARPRHTPIAGLVLTNGDLDHCLGLLSLRESQRLVVHATERVHRGFVDGNVLYRTLERFEGQVTWRSLSLGGPRALELHDGAPSGLTIEAVAVPGKPPLHLGHLSPEPEDNVAVRITDERAGKTLTYASGVGAMSPSVRKAVTGADAVFFDGTFWSSDELIAQGLGERRAEDMAHWPVGGPDGSLVMLGELGSTHRVLIHVNNTNPLLREDSVESEIARRAGVVVAYDGMELSL